MELVSTPPAAIFKKKVALGLVAANASKVAFAVRKALGVAFAPLVKAIPNQTQGSYKQYQKISPHWSTTIKNHLRKPNNQHSKKNTKKEE